MEQQPRHVVHVMAQEHMEQQAQHVLNALEIGKLYRTCIRMLSEVVQLHVEELRATLVEFQRKNALVAVIRAT